MSTVQRQLAAAAMLLAGALSAVAIAAGAGPSAARTVEAASVLSAPAALASSSHDARINQAFIARVNRVCARANAASQAAHGAFPFPDFDPLHPDPATLPRVGAFFARSQPIVDRVPGQLRRLGRPRAGKRPWSHLLSLAERSRQVADMQIKAALAGDIPGFVDTVKQVQATDTTIKHLALRAGFRASSPCGSYY